MTVRSRAGDRGPWPETFAVPCRWDDDCRTPRPRGFVDSDRVIGRISGDAHERAIDGVEQIEGCGRILTCPDDGQTRAVEHEMEALAGRHRSQTTLQMLTAPGERRLVGGGEPRRRVCHDRWPARTRGPGCNPRRTDGRCPATRRPPVRGRELLPGGGAYAVVRRTRRRADAVRGAAVPAGWGRRRAGTACACCARYSTSWSPASSSSCSWMML